MQTQIQDDNYWENRVYTDQRLDWRMGEKNWVDGYWKSLNHPHRRLIMDALRKFIPFESLLEVGCNCGPNLYLIKTEYPQTKLTGIDINASALACAKSKTALAGTDFRIANLNEKLSFEDKSFDILLADAVLMYVEPEKIKEVFKEFDRITRKGIIIVDWYDPLSLLGKIKDFHWTRNYQMLLKLNNFNTEKTKITKEIWDSKNWIKHGYIYIARRQ